MDYYKESGGEKRKNKKRNRKRVKKIFLSQKERKKAEKRRVRTSDENRGDEHPKYLQ